MRDQELVNALRCVSTAGGPIGDCKKCLFYKTEPVPEDLAGKVNLTAWSSCDVDAVGLAAADRIANQSTHIAALQQEIEKLRAQLPRWIPVEERLPELQSCGVSTVVLGLIKSENAPSLNKMMINRVHRAGLLAHIKNVTTTLTGASILLSVGGRLSAHPRAGAMWRRADNG